MISSQNVASQEINLSGTTKVFEFRIIPTFLKSHVR